MPQDPSERAQQLYAAGRFAEAMTAWQEALTADPENPELHSYLAVTQKEAGQIDDAIASFQRAIELDPEYAEAHCFLAAALESVGRLPEAIEEYRTAVMIDPEFHEAMNDLGNALRKDHQYDEAIEVLQSAVALAPNNPVIQYNLGGALFSRGRYDEAAQEFNRSLAQKADVAPAHASLASAYIMTNQWDPARTACEDALKLDPKNPEAHFVNARLMMHDRKLNDALMEFRLASQLDPKMVPAFTWMGVVLKELGQLDASLDAHRKAIDLLPTAGALHANYANALVACGDLENAISEYDQAIALDPISAASYAGNRLWTMYYSSLYSPEFLGEEHRRWNEMYVLPQNFEPMFFSNMRERERPLRIGYLSGDFCTHVAARFMLPLLQRHNRSEFEVYAYSNTESPDTVTAQIRNLVHAWRDIAGINDDAAASLILGDKIDILVDLSGHMAGNRIFVMARKPAPVQVFWLAYPGTTGLSTVDYRLTDPYLDPPESDTSWYTETSIRLPHSFWCYDPYTEDRPIGPLPALTNGYITFACLNRATKVSDDALRIWAELLNKLPNSKLILMDGGALFEDRVFRMGLDSQRVEFIGRLARPDYLDLHNRVDISLDPFPCGGHTSTFEDLWMGTPVVTLAGNMSFTRASVSILSNLGMPNLIASTPEQYLEIALQLASDLPRLKTLRETLRDRLMSSPLTDAREWTRGLEAAYRKMWIRWCDAQ